MTVTVIIPTGKAHVEFLPAALASAAAQTVPCRVLVANDSGEPLPFEVAPSVEVLSIPPPPLGYERGQRAAHARNYALQRVKTPLVTFLDADDAFTSPAVEVMLKAWQQDSSKYVYGDAHTIDSNGNFGTWTAKAYKPDLLLQHNIHTITTLMPVEWAVGVGGFDENFKAWEDWAFYLRLAVAGRYGRRIPVPLITYRLHTGDNRAWGQTVNGDLYALMRETYEAPLREAIMACGSCGGSKNKAASRNGVNNRMANQAPSTWVKLEFIGVGSGQRNLSREGRTYKFSAIRNFIDVHPDDVEWVMRNGLFRKVPKPSVPPIAETFSKEALTVGNPAKVEEVFVPQQMANDATSARKPKASK